MVAAETLIAGAICYTTSMKVTIFIFLTALVVIVATFLAVRQWLQQTSQEFPQPEVTVETSSTIENDTENTNPTHPQLKLFYPQDGGQVSSPLQITGEARGNWFFEATFPVVLTNWDGLIIAEGFATAEGDWMTEEFVPFSAEITFSSDTAVSNRGSLILQKANASGLPEHDDAYEITVFFE